MLGAIPADARRVGLVGAAVTDHPGIPEILRDIVDGGREVGISSLRADRLNDELVGPAQARRLPHADHRRRTAPPSALRDEIERKTKEQHLLRARRALPHARAARRSSST